MERINLDTKLYIHPYQSKKFNIYPEHAMPMNITEKVGTVELCEVVPLGDGDVMIPLQVYTTSDPLLYKLIVLLDKIKMEDFYTPIVCINETNIRSYLMTKEGKVFMPYYGRVNMEYNSLDANKRIEYQLIDITAQNNLIVSCDFSCKTNNNYCKQNLSEEERLRHFKFRGKIRYIVESFGFRENEITILSNGPEDDQDIIRFRVIGNEFFVKDNELFLENKKEC